MPTRRVNRTPHLAKGVAFTKRDLQDLWQERYEFNRSTLRLNPKKAKEWANRAVAAIKDTDTDRDF